MKTFALLLLVVMTPAIAFARAAIVGAVSDSSGAALAGTSAIGAGLLGSAVTPVSPYCHVANGVHPRFFKITAEISL